LYKKVLVVFIFVFCLSSSVFSAEAEPSGINPSPVSPAGKGRESVLAIGFEYGNFWGRYSDGTNDVKTYRSSPIIDLYYYTIRGGNIVGFFVHSYLFGFPTRGTVNGIQPEYTDYFGTSSGFILGPIFKHELNTRFALFYGAGPSFFLTLEDYTQNIPLTAAKESFEKYIYNIGIGVNVMLKYAVNNKLFLFAGCVSTWDFLSYVVLMPKSSNSALNTFDKTKDFSMFGIRPYVSIGFRL
jgi:hypothetical protein